MGDSITSHKSVCPRCHGRGLIEDPVKVGRSLREARRQASLTMAEVAARLGVSSGMVSDIESGRLNRRGGWTERFLAAVRQPSPVEPV